MTATDELRRAVEAHGWVVLTDDGAASTAGLTGHGEPEVVVLGLPPRTAGALLHEVAGQVLAGIAPSDGEPLTGLLADAAADPVLVTVTAALDDLPAVRLYGPGVVVRQLVWADAHGRFPWHPGFAHPQAQPLLGAPPAPAVAVSPVQAAHAAAGPPERWPLPDDPHLQVLTSAAVAEAGEPVLLVVCTDDGELRFLDGLSDFDPDQATVECLHEALERDLSLVEAVRPLQQGSAAQRDAVGAPWRVSPW